jgi:hypothetical protein
MTYLNNEKTYEGTSINFAPFKKYDKIFKLKHYIRISDLKEELLKCLKKLQT